MPEFIRVRDRETGTVQSIPAESAKSYVDLFEVLDDTPSDYQQPEFSAAKEVATAPASPALVKSGQSAEPKEK